MSEASFYFNVENRSVEVGPPTRGFSETRLGPYPTREEAGAALETLHQRNAEQDESDRRWRDG